MRRRKLYAEEIALMMEWRNEKIPVKLCARMLGISPWNFHRAIRKAKEHGYDAYPPRHPT